MTPTQPKSYVDDNVRRAEALTAPSPASKEPGPNASHCVTVAHGEPVFYLYENGTVTLCEHNGIPTRVGGRLFEEALGTGQDADDVAVTLWLRSRGKSTDDFDGPIHYPDRGVAMSPVDRILADAARAVVATRPPSSFLDKPRRHNASKHDHHGIHGFSFA